jgi:hypothetical protein
MWYEIASGALGWAAATRSPDGAYPLFNDAAIDAAPSIDDVVALGVAVDIMPRPVGRVESNGLARIVRLDPTGWLRLEVAGACAFVDAGPDAEGWQPGHAHADGLTFELWIGRERAIVDFGVATYEAGAGRDATRATHSHNTAELDGRDSCEVWGGFRVGRRGHGRVVACEVREGHLRIDLEHDGYAWLPGAPRHARSMTLRAGCLEVLDRMTGAKAEWVSRLRFDAPIESRVQVSARAEVRRRADIWYPRHGEASPAVLLEQRAKAGAPPELGWQVEW